MADRYFSRVGFSTWGKWVAAAPFEQEPIIGVTLEVVWPYVRHFTQNAPDTPDVYLGVVVLAFENNLGGSIPSSHHVARDFAVCWLFVFTFFASWFVEAALGVVIDSKTSVRHEVVAHVVRLLFAFFLIQSRHFGGYRVNIISLRRRHAGPRESKIAELNRAIGLEQDVSWLDISVHDSRRVNEIDSAQNIVKNRFEVLFLIRPVHPRFQHLLEVVGVEFHYQKYLFQTEHVVLVLLRN